MIELLLVEDEKAIVENLREFLTGEGFSVTSAAGQKEALDAIEERHFDIALLDVSLSDGNGFAVCAHLKKNTDTSVIFLTASGDECSVVTGLDMGADDYISKPFRPRELVSRIGACLRRSGKKQVILEAGNIIVDTMKAVVRKGEDEIFLSVLEYRILLILFQNKGMVLTREKLLEAIWDMAGEFVEDNTLTVYIKRLREKIEDDPAKPEIIRTIRGMGYGVF